MENQNDYLGLLKTYVQIVNANKGVGSIGDDRILDAEGLALKFFGHAVSLYYLYSGISIPERGLGIADFVDPSSINVVGRAAIETFLTFHYVFVEPKTNDEKDFRYFAWELAGLLERQGFTFRSPLGKKKLEEERKLIESLRNKLKKNLSFITCPINKKEELNGVIGAFILGEKLYCLQDSVKFMLNHSTGICVVMLIPEILVFCNSDRHEQIKRDEN